MQFIREEGYTAAGFSREITVIDYGFTTDTEKFVTEIMIPLQKVKKSSRVHSWVYVRQYCVEIDEAARNRMELIVRSLAEQNGVTEQLKAENQMEWVRQMNACKAQAEEIVKAELIYD